MESIKVFDDLVMFNSYFEFIDLGFNQYLLLGSEPMLIHTGSKDQTAAILPKIQELLGDKPLAYIFISHFEPDELLGMYPGALRIIGGVDKIEIAKGKEEIDRYLHSIGKMVVNGGYISHIDHDIPPSISEENFIYYLETKRKL